MTVTAPDLITLPLKRIALATSVSALVAGSLAALLASGFQALDGLTGAILVALSCFASVGVLGAIGPRPAVSIPPLLLAGSMLRLIVSLVLGLVFFLVLRPEGMWYWSAFLVASLAALFADTVISLRVMRDLNREPSP